ncbi:MAG: hypothetical protein H6715_04575 [Myxococcales bacterium]|nr:hypothetical protein [Myxococcales bacterium]
MFDAAAELAKLARTCAFAPCRQELEEETEQSFAVADGDDRNMERLADLMLDKVDTDTCGTSVSFLCGASGMSPRPVSLQKCAHYGTRDKIVWRVMQANRRLQIVPDPCRATSSSPMRGPAAIAWREARLRFSGRTCPGAGHILPNKLVVRTSQIVPPGCNIHLNGGGLPGKPRP